MTPQRPPTIDPQAAARWSHTIPPSSAWLHEEVARRMEQRLELIKVQPRTWVHWDPMLGGLQAHGLLARRYPKSRCFVPQAPVERSHAAMKNIVIPWWKLARWLGPVTEWGAPPAPVQMLWANMALHMAADPQALIAQWHTLLDTDGFLMFTCLGPDTLRELRGLYAAMGWPAASHEFTDMHDWGDMLVNQGFAEPVMDMERITLSFATPQRLLAELRELGRNLHPQRFQGLRGRGWHTRLLSQLRQHLAPAGSDEPLTLTFEVIYGHAFKPAPRPPVQAETRLSLDEMRATLRQVNKKPPIA